MISILHISSASGWRGGEKQISNLFKGFEKINTKTNQYLLCRLNSSLHSYSSKNNIQAITYKGKGLGLLLFGKRLFNVVKSNNIDLIHVHDSKAHNYAVYSQYIYNFYCPIVVSRKVVFPLNKNIFTKFKYNFKSIKKIISISTAVKMEIEKNNLLPETEIIMDSIDTGLKLQSNYLRKKFSFNANEKIIGYVAALTNEKDHYTFLNTAKQILNKGKKCHFVIVGEGKNEKHLIEYSKKIEIFKSITFTGFIPDVNKYLSDFDICLFTSTNEGLGSSILDFFLAKVPVVATNAGGIKDIVKEGVTGCLCNVSDYMSLADKVIRVLENGLLRNEVVNNAYEYVIENHSLETLAGKHLHVYKEALLVGNND